MNVFMWEHPCTNCVRPMPLAGLGLGLMWMQVTSFIWVCWSITLLGVDWKWRGQSCHTQHDMGLPLCSVTITTLSGGLIPSGWSRSPEGRAQTSYVPSECVCIFFFFFLHCPGGGSALEEGSEAPESSKLECRPQWLFSDTSLSASLLCPSQLIPDPSLCSPFSVMELLCRVGRAHVDS